MTDILSTIQTTDKMASEVVSKVKNLVTGESKSARKKKTKQDSTAAATAVPAATEKTASEAGAGGSDPSGNANGEHESAYIKELQK